MRRSIQILAFLVAVGAVSGCGVPVRNPNLYGASAPVSTAERTIIIRPDTKHVNVEGGQIVAFVAGDKQFAWHFMVGAGISSFKLNDVAPPGALDHVVTAYVSPDPRYMGGGDRGK